MYAIISNNQIRREREKCYCLETSQGYKSWRTGSLYVEIAFSGRYKIY